MLAVMRDALFMQYLSLLPNIDDQSLLHRGDWPYGRTNHYFFDLNRDFFYSTQPETQGRVKLILMGPPSQPLNTNISPSLQEWARVFARDQGEWFENWYPGESN